MRHPVPLIHEEAAALKPRLHQAYDARTTPRLHMLYLLATRQAQDRQAVARWLGVHRHTISRWLALYAAGGLEALLALDIPAGTRVSLAPAVLAGLQQALQHPEGFASSEALRQWRRRTHGVEVQDTTLDTIVRTRFKAKRKVPRPRHTKKA
jgi:hypothetical protein